MIPGMAVSGGQGGVDLSAGPATSGADSTSGDSGNSFMFAAPESVQKAQAAQGIAWPVAIGAVALVWLLLKR